MPSYDDVFVIVKVIKFLLEKQLQIMTMFLVIYFSFEYQTFIFSRLINSSGCLCIQSGVD
jgi:hypothetical protein